MDLSQPFQQSKLIQLINSLDIGNAKVDHHRFGERLGELIFLSDSFALADAHGRIARASRQHIIGTEDSELEKIFRLKAALIERILKSYTQDAPRHFAAPFSEDPLDNPETIEFDPWRKFYLSGQREMAVHINKCRSLARDLVSARSDKLAQLALLDASMAVVLEAPQQRALATIPKLLAKVFKQHLADYQDKHDGLQTWRSDTDGLLGLYDLFRSTMLAECEFRFEPVMGLLQALENED